LWDSTDSDGHTSMKPISWDYRFSNLCNFKCRMCGDMLSSSWETEQRKNNMINWHNPKNNWMKPDIRKQISEFQDTQIEKEFSAAVEEHRVEEIYWVGGEPLMYEQHWRYMKRIVELGDGPRLYARYNTNLSRVKYKGIDLFDDILSNIRDWQICASLDGTGPIGEYIRTGLNYNHWLENFERATKYARHKRQVRLDFTLTLPGLFEVGNIQKLSEELGVGILAKVIFSFGPDILLSPLALPRKILERKVDEISAELPNGALKDVIQQLKNRPTFEEEWPDTFEQAAMAGKDRLLNLEKIRTQPTTMAYILEKDPEIYEWWKNIRTD